MASTSRIFEYFVVCGLGPEIRALDGVKGFHGDEEMYMPAFIDQFPHLGHALYPPPPPQLPTVTKCTVQSTDVDEVNRTECAMDIKDTVYFNEEAALAHDATGEAPRRLPPLLAWVPPVECRRPLPVRRGSLMEGRGGTRERWRTGRLLERLGRKENARRRAYYRPTSSPHPAIRSSDLSPSPPRCRRVGQLPRRCHEEPAMAELRWRRQGRGRGPEGQLARTFTTCKLLAHRCDLHEIMGPSV